MEGWVGATMFESATEHEASLVDAISRLCQKFPEEYWQARDAAGEYPLTFVDALTSEGWLGMLIPEHYGGGGAPVADAAVVLETINRSGASAYAAHAQMYTMGTILRHGSEEQKQRILPDLASGRARLQAFGVTEADAGSDTTAISTFATRAGSHYVVSGQKMWTSRVQHSDWMLLLARTRRPDECQRRTDGLSIFLVDLRVTEGITIEPIRTMVNHETNAVFFDEVVVPAENLVGEEGRGFSYLLSGLNVERILVASEALGDGFWFVNRAAAYATEREVFGRSIGQNQAIQFPLALAYANLHAARLMRAEAARLYDGGGQPGFEANSAKLLASRAAWEAANAAMETFGGYGLAREYGIERKFRDARLNLIAPVSSNMILSYIGHKVLGMPRSY